MARKRMLDPSIWEDPDVCTMQPLAIILFIGLISYADDDGRGIADPRYLRKAVFGFNDSVTTEQVKELLEEVDRSIRGLSLYNVNGRDYYALLHWNTYQKVNHPKPSVIPAPSVVSGSELDSSDDAGVVFRYWESTGQIITSAVAQEITAMIEEWNEYVDGLSAPNSDKEISGVMAAKEAIRVGVQAKTRPHINYIWGILRNWMTNGYKASVEKPVEKKKKVKSGLTKDQIRLAKAKAEASRNAAQGVN